MYGYSFLYVWGPVLVFVAIIIGLIILAVKNTKLFLAIILSFLCGFGLPFAFLQILHLFGYISPPQQGGSIPLPNDLPSLFFLIYFIFPIPFSIPTIITFILFRNYFSKKLLK